MDKLIPCHIFASYDAHPAAGEGLALSARKHAHCKVSTGKYAHGGVEPHAVVIYCHCVKHGPDPTKMTLEDVFVETTAAMCAKRKSSKTLAPTARYFKWEAMERPAMLSSLVLAACATLPVCELQAVSDGNIARLKMRASAPGVDTPSGIKTKERREAVVAAKDAKRQARQRVAEERACRAISHAHTQLTAAALRHTPRFSDTAAPHTHPRLTAAAQRRPHGSATHTRAAHGCCTAPHTMVRTAHGSAVHTHGPRQMHCAGS